MTQDDPTLNELIMRMASTVRLLSLVVGHRRHQCCIDELVRLQRRRDQARQRRAARDTGRTRRKAADPLQRHARDRRENSRVPG
eukprot:scaffold39746_cov74-Cyclotella_meneghiniana.AAC.13